jgi:hypothetical protein
MVVGLCVLVSRVLACVRACGTQDRSFLADGEYRRCAVSARLAQYAGAALGVAAAVGLRSAYVRACVRVSGGCEEYACAPFVCVCDCV